VGSSVLWRHILGIFSQIFSRSPTTTTTQRKQKKSRVIFERSAQNSIAKFFVLFHVENNDLPSVVVAYFQDSTLFKPVTLDLITRSKIVLVYLNGMFNTEI